MAELLIIFTILLLSQPYVIPARSSGFVIINHYKNSKTHIVADLPYRRNMLKFNDMVFVSHTMLAAGTIMDELKNNILLLLRRYASNSLALCWLHVYKNRCTKKKDLTQFFKNLLYITLFVLFLTVLRSHQQTMASFILCDKQRKIGHPKSELVKIFIFVQD